MLSRVDELLTGESCRCQKDTRVGIKRQLKADRGSILSYKTIRKRTEASFTEKKSEFIGYISPAATEEEADRLL